VDGVTRGSLPPPPPVTPLRLHKIKLTPLTTIKTTWWTCFNPYKYNTIWTNKNMWTGTHMHGATGKFKRYTEYYAKINEKPQFWHAPLMPRYANVYSAHSWLHWCLWCNNYTTTCHYYFCLQRQLTKLLAKSLKKTFCHKLEAEVLRLASRWNSLMMISKQSETTVQFQQEMASHVQ